MSERVNIIEPRRPTSAELAHGAVLCCDCQSYRDRPQHLYGLCYHQGESIEPERTMYFDTCGNARPRCET
jgi:hypothetical protein